MPGWLNITLFLSGAVLMGIALVRAWAFAPRVRPRSSRLLWLGLTSFIAVFLIGYLVAVALTFSGNYQVLVGLTSAVFFGGAFFVLLTIYLTTHLNSDLTKASARQEGLIRELEVKNNALESFCYAASHDLKSPLVTIRGFLGLVRTDAESGKMDEVLHDIKQIERAAKRMQQVMEELLDLGIAGKIVREPVSVPLNDVVAEAQGLTAEFISASGLVVSVPPDLPTVLVDRGRLVTVFQNLIENSAKFTGEQAEPRMEIKAEMNKHGMVACTVSDNGAGICSPNPDQVFQIFTRLKADVDGHGVGLALVKRIVEAHGGIIRVESQGAGKGCTFRFTLPAT